MEYEKERADIAYYMTRLYERGLTTCSGGNVSCRIGEDAVAMTPSGLDKGRLTAGQIGLMKLEGENLTPELKPSIEAALHLELYKTRSDINAIVHAHPPIATSFTATERKINCVLIAETRAVLGEPVTAPYGLMGTRELALAVAEAARKGNVVLMENHGVVTLGKTLHGAYDRIEVLEAAAKITLVTSLLGQVRELDEEKVRDIDSFFSLSL